MSKLFYNLLFKSKIIHELNNKAIFLPDFVSFKDFSLGKMIGITRHSRGLYLLDDDTSSSSISRTSLLSLYFTTSKQDYMLWHFRLGHPNFQYMKHLFPHLFFKIDVYLILVCMYSGQTTLGFFSFATIQTNPPFHSCSQ